MRDSSVFSFSGEPRSLIFRPREHVPRWRRLGWRSFRLPRGGRVFLDERGELSSRARSFASVRRAGECAHADRDGLDAVGDAGIADHLPDIAVGEATRLRPDRKSVGSGKGVTVSLNPGGSRTINKKKITIN